MHCVNCGCKMTDGQALCMDCVVLDWDIHYPTVNDEDFISHAKAGSGRE